MKILFRHRRKRKGDIQEEVFDFFSQVI